MLKVCTLKYLTRRRLGKTTRKIMKKLVKDPKQPLPLFTQREDGVRQEKAFGCGECGSVYATTESALRCCKQDYCQDCGVEVNQHWNKCSSCSEFARNEKAVLLTKWDGPVYDDSRDKYYESIEELAEWYEDESEDDRPEFIFPCKEVSFKGLDADDILMNATEDLFEDAYDHLKGVDLFRSAVERFNEAQDLKTWSPDFSRKIKLADCL
jgi:hypothetical protein